MYHRSAGFVFFAPVLLAAIWAQVAVAQSVSSEAYAVSDARPATLHIWRSSAGADSPGLRVNGMPIGRLGSGGYLSQQLPAGPVVLEVTDGTQQSLTLASGQTSYWRLDFKSLPGAAAGAKPQPWLQEVPANQARLEIQQISR